MTAKAEQKERTRQSILDSAARMVRQHGIAGAKVADVMKAAGLTVGGFYAHFDSKEALIDEALRRTGDQNRASIFDHLDAKPEADRALVVLKRYLSVTHRDLEGDGCPMPAVVGEIGARTPEHRDALVDHVEKLIQSFAAQTRPNAQKITKRTLAVGLVAMMYGGLSLARATKGTPLSDEVLDACRAVGKLALDWAAQGKQKAS